MEVDYPATGGAIWARVEILAIEIREENICVIADPAAINSLARAGSIVKPMPSTMEPMKEIPALAISRSGLPETREAGSSDGRDSLDCDAIRESFRCRIDRDDD